MTLSNQSHFLRFFVTPESHLIEREIANAGRKNWILPQEMNANRFFWDSHWLEIWSNLHETEWKERGYGF
jgi:hypothetical protein